jgi:flavin-binding protein dodecin
MKLGLARASKTLRNITSAWIKEQRLDIKDGSITGYQVNMMVTFVIDD